MLKHIKSLARMFQNTLLAPPDGRLLRRSVINGVLALGVSLSLVSIIFGVAALLGISVKTPDWGNITIVLFVLIVIIAPLIETLILAGFFLLIPRRLGLIKRAIISAIIWGILHALSAPVWFFGVVFSFFVYSCSYLVWRQKSFARGFVAAAVPHAVVNFLCCMILIIASPHNNLFDDDSYLYLYNSVDKLPFKEKAEQGDMEAQWKLGHWLYCSVKRQHEDPKNEALVEAAIWLRAAAEQGHPSAQSFLGQCYWLGHGVEMDCAEAIKWYRKGAEQGCGSSQMRLAQAYMYGWHGMEQDETESVKWYRKVVGNPKSHSYHKKEAAIKLKALEAGTR